MRSLDGRTGTYTIDTKALLEGRGVRRFSTAEFNPATLNRLVLTGLAFNIPINSFLIVNEINGYVESVSSNCAFWLIRCTGENGSGTYEIISEHLHIFIGAAAVPPSGEFHAFNPPIVVKYSEGWRSVTILAQSSAVGTVINCGWAGFWEPE